MATTKATTLAHTIASTTSSTADLNYAKTLNDTGVTSTEFDKLDGLTATTDELNLVDGSVTGPLSHRNMIINGAMNVHQRGGTISYAHDGTTNGYSLDRFRLTFDNPDEWHGTVEQHTMTSAELNTTGFAKAYKLTTGTAESAIASNEAVYISQIIEAQNLQHLQYGTASAKTITLSFWVKSSVTGTYAVGLYKPDTTSRLTNKTYTVSDTNWNQYTLTFSGDTDSGATIANDNGRGIFVNWHLAAGSNNNAGANTSWENYSSGGWAGGHAQDGIITTASATFYLTGVQLELGSVATPFEHRSYADELQRCNRYYQKWTNSAAYGSLGVSSMAGQISSTKAMGSLQYKTDMRSRTAMAATSSDVQLCTGSACHSITSVTLNSAGTSGTILEWNGTTTGTNYTTNYPYVRTSSANGYVAFDSEL